MAERDRRAVLVAGVADAGLNSLASFAAGLYAVRTLEPASLGAYALVFAAFNLLRALPAQLLFVPAENAAASLSPAECAGLAGHSLRTGAPAALLAAWMLPAWLLAAPPGIPPRTAAVLTGTAVACTLVSPLQDHLRRMLHVAGRSGAAACVSAVQVAVVAAALAAPGIAPGPEWVPFGSLAAGNTLSLAFGLALLRGAGRGRRGRPELSARTLAGEGRWLMLASVTDAASSFAAAVVVGHLAGAATLGLTEAARVIGSPVIVLAVGLSAVLGPRSVRAARARNPAEAGRVAALFGAMVLAFGMLYLAVAGFRWALNPLAVLMPRGYAVPGLAAVAIVAATAHGSLSPRRAELVGLGAARSVARINLASAVLRMGISATAGLVGAFALPLGYAAQAMAQRAGYLATLRRIYAAGPVSGPGDVPGDAGAAGPGSP